MVINDLNGVWGRNANDIWITSGHGDVFHLSNNFFQEVWQGSGNFLDTVWVPSTGTDVWVGGEYGSILHRP
jgi:hypothetical protein